MTKKERRERREYRNRQMRNRTDSVKLDLMLIVIVAFIIAFGLVMIYSASYYESMLQGNDPGTFLKKQLIATVVAAVVMTVCSLIDYHFWVKISGFICVASLLLVFAVLTPLGMEVNGARRWIRIAGQSLQPAEVVKVAVILVTVYIIGKMTQKQVESLKGMLYIMGPAVVFAGLVYVITDNMSSAIIIAAVASVMLFIVHRDYKMFVILAVVVVVFSALSVAYIGHKPVTSIDNFREKRIHAWLYPDAYASDTAFQTLQALYSIGSGGMFGKGLGQSMQKLGTLPEAQNDMIFSIVCEELGLFGAVTVLLLFFLLILRLKGIAERAPDLQGSLITVGVLAHIAVQVIMNVAVVTNFIPNTGVTLPFISYGGTSVVFTLMEIGMVLNVTGQSYTVE